MAPFLLRVSVTPQLCVGRGRLPISRVPRTFFSCLSHLCADVCIRVEVGNLLVRPRTAPRHIVSELGSARRKYIFCCLEKSLYIYFIAQIRANNPNKNFYETKLL
jgi:hypothetical protein